MAMGGLYGHHGLTQRPESASSASPPSHGGHFPSSPPSHGGHFPGFPPASSAAGMLVVPQPINASKVWKPLKEHKDIRDGNSNCRLNIMLSNAFNNFTSPSLEILST